MTSGWRKLWIVWMAKSAIQIETPDFDGVLGGLSLLMLPPARKRRFLARQARMVIAQAQKNVRDQKTIDGAPFVPRADGSGRPMLRKLTKSKWLGVKVMNDDEAQVYFYSKKVKDRQNGKDVWRNQGAVANKHQKGGKAAGWPGVRQINYRRRLDGSKVPTRLNRENVKTAAGYPGCSANQAAMLLRLDYLPPKLRGKVPAGAAGIRFVMRNIHRGLAGKLIAAGIEKRGKTMGPDRTPARPFLGAGTRQRQIWASALLRDIDGSFKAKNYIGLLK